MTPGIWRSAAAAWTFLLLVTGPTWAQDTGDIFARPVLHDVRLFMHSRDVQLLSDDVSSNRFYAADIQIDGVRVRNVGVRSRGGGSRFASKPGLLVEAGRYVRGQTMSGREALVLDNLVQDASMIREAVAMALFARLGQPASLESFARLYVNEEFYGVYALVEAIDRPFLERTLGEARGYLHEYHWLDEYRFGRLGIDYDEYQRRFEPRTRDYESDSALFGPLREMIEAINGPQDSTWRSAVERHLDLRQLITSVAIENFTAEWDGILGYAGINNFHLYRPATSGQHIVVPWDRDHAFHDLESSVFEGVAENPLVNRALMEPDLRALYLDVLEAAARLAATGWLEAEIRAAAAVAHPAAVDDVRAPLQAGERASTLQFLIEFARRRPQIVLDEVARARAAGAARFRSLAATSPSPHNLR